jgi:hypothetical protein
LIFTEKPVSSTSGKKKKPTWDNYLTDPDRFKLTKEEIIMKKQALISKHNIFSMFGDQDGLSTPSTRGRSASVTSTSSKKRDVSSDRMIKDKKKNIIKVSEAYSNLSALDYIATPAPNHSMKPVSAATTACDEVSPSGKLPVQFDLSHRIEF